MTHTPEPMTRPKSLNMLAEDSVDNVFRPTPNPSSESPNSTENSTEALTSSADEPKGRALNFTIEEENRDNILSNSSRHHNDFDLSDVTIHDDDFDMDYNSKILGPKSQLHNLTLGKYEI
ncbi:hypothetical protein NQ314_007417 [Rhamnusium bicolor]|uniref:Uncharacterized protein n=1 Tax=Rhamnusium bicolor TaxID=1586634 RepID=A0AAV8YQ22_9CUCU|nr:hypothetical protein NQ314_007417 [Rhamnusium bicolor]